MSQKLVFTDNPAEAIGSLLNDLDYSGTLFVLADENTAACCLPLIKDCLAIRHAHVITIASGDEHKNLQSLSHVWEELSANGATRRSLMITLGGGVVTDLGGFAAATFKRGIRFINIPTTLLAAVDAAVGGKTGINFCGLKNEIGAFQSADAVVISAKFYATLPFIELLSGYGEVLKHALIDSPEALSEALQFSPAEADPTGLSEILRRSVEVKKRIVTEDPYEHGIRRALNLGHTAAHAFEALAMNRHEPLAHGVAVAHGLISDLVMSHLRLGFPSETLQKVASFIRANYPAPAFGCKDYPELIGYMRHDKKNSSADAINFTLLAFPGQIRIDCLSSPDEITSALDIARDLLGA